MDQTIISALSNSGSLGIIALLAMQAYQMFLDAQKATHHKEIQDFQAQIDELKNQQVKNVKMIEDLQKEIYELKRENGELRGLLEAQEDKENLVHKYVQKRAKTTK